MTDLDPLDELASAHLDGATTPEEAALIAADPDLLARVEALRAVRLLVASPPPVDDAQREAAIAAALAAYDADGEATASPATAARPLTPVARRRLGSARGWRVAGVAAAVAALVALVPILASRSSESSDDVASESSKLGTADRNEDAGASDTTPTGAEALGPTSTTALQRAIDLGAFEDDDDLVAAARATPTPPSGAFVAPTTADAGGCLADLIASLPPDAPLVLTATARLDGAPVDVVVTDDEVRIAGGDCTDVLVRPR